MNQASFTSHGTAARAVLFPAKRFWELRMICGNWSIRNGMFAPPENLAVHESHSSYSLSFPKPGDPFEKIPKIKYIQQQNQSP